MLKVKPGAMTMADMRAFYHKPSQIELKREPGLEKSAAFINHIISSNKSFYGINTGFGKLATQRIDTNALQQLQVALLKSHSCGVGEPIASPTVRLALLLKINALAQGFSGVRYEIIQGLANLLNQNAIPYVPSQGSVGASGDLAPLAHLCGSLLGEGKIYYQQTWQDSKIVLEKIGQPIINLGPKEGLALINGTQISHAFALQACFLTEACWRNAVILGAMSLEGFSGSHVPFDARIHQLRRHPGQIRAATCYRHLLGKCTEISDAHQHCDRVQDPYSLRCQPQVMGACLQQLWHVQTVLSNEINAVTDNPLIFAQTQEVLTGGNFHAQAISMACDNMALVLSEIGCLAERRIALFMDTELSGLPAFLIKNHGLNSGFMIAQVTAAALVSENKMLSHPASVDSIPTSANQEDHVSMATHSARRLLNMAENTQNILAIEWLVAAQAIDLKRPLHTSSPLEKAHRILRQVVPTLTEDRILATDIEHALHLLKQEKLAPLLPTSLWMHTPHELDMQVQNCP